MLPPAKLSLTRASNAGRPPFWVKVSCTVALPVVPLGLGLNATICLSRPLKLGSTMRSKTVSLLARPAPLTISWAETAS
ncbi:hypothetical protein D3C71_1764790 [compost metagenome]